MNCSSFCINGVIFPDANGTQEPGEFERRDGCRQRSFSRVWTRWPPPLQFGFFRTRNSLMVPMGNRGGALRPRPATEHLSDPSQKAKSVVQDFQIRVARPLMSGHKYSA